MLRPLPAAAGRQARRVAGLFAAWLIAVALAGVSAAVAQTALTDSIVAAARRQIGVTRHYDSSYTRLAYPDGDVPAERGVCTDVVIRALRDAGWGDLQKNVHEDMRANFSAYPKNWGLSRPDRNIDHRRVPNLQTYFKRHAVSLRASHKPQDYRPGDLVTSMLPGNLPHIMIVSDRKAPSGTPLVIHNIGQGTHEEDALFAYPLSGHYRLREYSKAP